MSLFFNSQHMPPPSGEYVAWCDGMGTGRSLANSLHHAANFIFKLHRAFSLALDELGAGHDVRIYPIMDGMYITTKSRHNLQTVIRRAFVELADEFVSHTKLSRHFLVRGGIAYGLTLHGSAIHEDAFIPNIGHAQEAATRVAFQESHLNETRSHLLLSAAMVAAYSSESLAPPFGLYVDDSALSVPQLVDAHDQGFHSRLWRWWGQTGPSKTSAEHLWPALKQYFENAGDHRQELAYPKESLAKHKEWAEEFFHEFIVPG